MTSTDTGFICYLTVLRPPGIDCTNGGASAPGHGDRLALYRNPTFALLHEAMLRSGSTPPTAPSVTVERNAFGSPIIVPVRGNEDGKSIGPMMGGNYATGDSRLSEEIERVTGQRFYGAVAIHDRYETPAEYRALSI